MKSKWVELAMRLAEAAAPTSIDKFHKVGAAVLRVDGSVCGIGYNGQPPGINLSFAELMDRDERRKITVHAESNALAFCKPGEPHLLAVTLPPCERCLVEAARYGIKTIVCKRSNDESHKPNCKLAKRLNIELIVV